MPSAKPPGGALCKSLGLALQLRLERIVERALQQRLGAPVNGGRSRREALCGASAFPPPAPPPHHLVDKAQAFGRRGIEAVGEHRDLGGLLEAHEPRQRIGRAAIRRHADRGMRA